MPCDFFVVEYVKSLVQIPSTPTLVDQLKIPVNEALATINADMLVCAWQKMEYRLTKGLQ